MTEVTRILNKIEDRDPTAASQLLPQAYENLKRLAAIKIHQCDKLRAKRVAIKFKSATDKNLGGVL